MPQTVSRQIADNEVMGYKIYNIELMLSVVVFLHFFIWGDGDFSGH